MTQQRNTKAMAGAAAVGTLAAITLIISITTVSTSDAKERVQKPADKSTAMARYEPISGDIDPEEMPEIFDGKKNMTGVVIGVADADTFKTRKACDEVWSAYENYQALCVGLKDQKILTVKLDQFSQPVMAHVPISKIAKVNVGEKVLIQTGIIEFDGSVRALPRYLRTIAF